MVPQQLVLICILAFVPSLVRICEAAKQGRTCLKYETYLYTEYGIQPYHDPFSHWLSHRHHRVPRKFSRMGIRTKSTICCDLGYVHLESTSLCTPVCHFPCKQNEQCSAPNLCECNAGFRRVDIGLINGPSCVPIERTTTSAPMNTTVFVSESTTTTPTSTTTTTTTTTATPPTTTKPPPTSTTPTTTSTMTPTTTTTPSTTTTTTTTPTPTPTVATSTPSTITSTEREDSTPSQSCHGCAANELCSGDICVCKEGYRPSIRNGTSKCEPKCEPACHHADCVEPNNCACWPGYSRTNATSCHQSCSKDTCAFGECTENGTCACRQGSRSNGTACIWVDDGILPEPIECDCWLRVNDATEEQCLTLCDHRTAEQPSTDCINSTLCQLSGVTLACQDQLYKCSAEVPVETTDTSTSGPDITEKLHTHGHESPRKTIFLVVGLIAIVLSVAICAYFWLKYRNRLSRSSPYRHMEDQNLI